MSSSVDPGSLLGQISYCGISLRALSSKEMPPSECVPVGVYACVCSHVCVGGWGARQGQGIFFPLQKQSQVEF